MSKPQRLTAQPLPKGLPLRTTLLINTGRLRSHRPYHRPLAAFPMLRCPRKGTYRCIPLNSGRQPSSGLNIRTSVSTASHNAHPAAHQAEPRTLCLHHLQQGYVSTLLGHAARAFLIKHPSPSSIIIVVQHAVPSLALDATPKIDAKYDPTDIKAIDL